MSNPHLENIVSPRRAVCSACSNVFVSDSSFCHKCGTPRPGGPPEAEGSEPLDDASPEGFARRAAACLAGEGCLVVCFRPWGSAGGAPAGVLAPVAGGSEAMLGSLELSQAIQGKHTVIAPCTFATKEEEAAARKILQQFSVFQHICVFIVQLLGTSQPAELPDVEAIMKRHDAMVATGVDDVILIPNIEPQTLRSAVALARSAWLVNVQRVKLMVEAQPAPKSPDELDALETQLRHILWDDIPRALMPHFPTVDRHLAESLAGVGGYRYINALETRSASVMHAVHTNSGNECAIKIVDKSAVVAATEIEGLYREFRFLADIMKHPSISRCIEMLHSTSKVYLVFEFAGRENLAQILSRRSSKRFDSAEALGCFHQFVSGLAYCHEKGMAHRNVSLENLVLMSAPSGDRCCRLVDFHSAMVARPDSTSRTVVGTLPCMAPEIALQQPYVPQLADCWSAGVVLLEISGGMTSLSRSVPFDVESEPGAVAELIVEFCAHPWSHEYALAFMGGVRDNSIIHLLERLLLPEPSNRSKMKDCLNPVDHENR